MVAPAAFVRNLDPAGVAAAIACTTHLSRHGLYTPMMAVKFGVFVPQGWRMDLVKIKDPIEKYEAMTGVAQEADKGRWDSIWVYDHFHTTPEPKLEATFECWTITSTLVRDTKRVRVGQMVGCTGYRNPPPYP